MEVKYLFDSGVLIGHEYTFNLPSGVFDGDVLTLKSFTAKYDAHRLYTNLWRHLFGIDVTRVSVVDFVSGLSDADFVDDIECAGNTTDCVVLKFRTKDPIEQIVNPPIPEEKVAAVESKWLHLGNPEIDPVCCSVLKECVIGFTFDLSEKQIYVRTEDEEVVCKFFRLEDYHTACSRVREMFD